MSISVTWPTGVIYVPQSYLTNLGGGVYELDVDQFRLDLKDLEDDDQGMGWLDTHRHNTESTLSGVTYARQVEIINGYTVEFENGSYTVVCVGANHNLGDVKVVNSVSLIIGNSAGLITVRTPYAPTESHVAAALDNTTLKLSVWMERLGEVVLAPTACAVRWYDPDGTLLFSVTNSGPANAQGVFEIERTPTTLASNTPYYAEVDVTDAEGTVTTQRGVPTGP
jgi:hypothetical protein